MYQVQSDYYRARDLGARCFLHHFLYESFSLLFVVSAMHLQSVKLPRLKFVQLVRQHYGDELCGTSLLKSSETLDLAETSQAVDEYNSDLWCRM